MGFSDDSGSLSGRRQVFMRAVHSVWWMTHPSLAEYPLDEDYCGVDNDTPSSATGKAAVVDPDESNREYAVRRERGSGASSPLDDIRDEMAVISNDGRSVTRTTFYAWQANGEERQKQYEKLAKWNDGMWDSSRSGRNKKADNDRWIDGFCSVLECSSYVQSRVEYIIESVNLRHMATYSAQQTILATIELVERNERLERGGKPLTEDETFHELATAVGSSVEEMRKIRRLVREKSPEFEYDGGKSA